MQQISEPATTPEAISALRARIFVSAADEIARIDVVPGKDLVIGRIGVALDAVHRSIGKSEREFVQADDRLYSLLSEAFTAVFGTRIRSRSHLYNELKRHVCQEKDIYRIPATERDRIAQLLRKIAGKLTNGHAGVWI
jgi:hypothetical protein